MDYVLRHVTHASPSLEKEQVLRFSRGDYLDVTRSRLAAPWGNEAYVMVGAFSADGCIGTTSCTVSPHRLGILSQVYTDEACRGHGVARAVVGEAVAVFRQHRTRAAWLASAKPWVRAFYQSFGFLFVGAMGERHGFKLELDPSGADGVLFKSDQRTVLREIGEDDQASLCALFNAQHDAVVKHYELGCYLGSYFEGEFYTLRREKAESGYRGVVLDGEEATLGLGTVVPSKRRHQTHSGVLDVLVHPNYAGSAPEIVDHLVQDTPLERISAYAGKADTLRRQTLEHTGFRHVGTSHGHLRIGQETFDLDLYEWTR